MQSGQPEAAQNKCEQILALEPDNPAAHFELGRIALKLDQHETAIERISRAIEFDSGNWVFHNVLGEVHVRHGNWPAATRCFRRAVALDPDDPAAYINLGGVLIRQHELPAAANALHKALSINPDAANVQHNLALTLHQLGDDQEAAALFTRLAAHRPDFREVHYNLGVVLTKLERFDEAVTSYRQALKWQPDFAAIHNNLGSLLTALNDPNGAISCYRNALVHQPNHAQAYSNLLMTLNYLPQLSQHEMYLAAKKFEADHASDLSPRQTDFHHSAEAEKKLRIGYLSSDFRTHSVAWFIRNLPDAHQRNRIEVFCYANVAEADAMTGEIEAQTDHWLSIAGMRDADVVDRIKADQIDILIDLGGHTGNNRLLVFARRPAPVQVTWLGYPNTTGMAHMDYRLTDAIADPPGETDNLYSEQLVRLPHGFLCYQPDQAGPDVVDPPCLKQGHITFGSFNNYPKLTPDVIRVWSKILHQSPGSRLILKSRAMLGEKTRERCALQFAEHGISPERVDLLATVPTRKEHLALYSKIDIGLDPFPYNGTTTTCEALLMGVPVIALHGDRHAGRVGASIMSRAGLSELIAANEAEYISLAKELAGDRQKLVKMRKELRPQMLESELMDLTLFTESLEHAYREMWLTWCNEK